MNISYTVTLNEYTVTEAGNKRYFQQFCTLGLVSHEKKSVLWSIGKQLKYILYKMITFVRKDANNRM